MNVHFNSAQQAEEWIIDWLKNETDIPESSIAIDTPLADYAMDSVDATLLVSDLGKIVKREIDIDIIWDAQDIRELVAKLLPMIEPAS